MSRIYFLAGETSGDNHGAELVAALRARAPEVEFFGRGGPRMRAAGGEGVRDWVADAAVLGLWEVLRHYNFFRREFALTLREIEQSNPDAVVLIDYPGFNLRLARALKEKSRRALRVIYYISPQVWAWNQGRISAMARCIDLMLCIFPFEPQLYEAKGLRAVFVGHPMANALASGASEPERDPQLVGIFPGSREREVRKIFPVMHRVARELLRAEPDLRFEVAAASERLAEMIRRIDPNEPDFAISVAQPRELMKRASAAMIASGTATLEAALLGLPFVLVYRVAWLTYLAASLVVKVKYLGMPNVLLERPLVPEFIQHNAQPAKIAAAVLELLRDQQARARMLAGFAAIRQELGAASASGTAAEMVLAELRR